MPDLYLVISTRLQAAEYNPELESCCINNQTSAFLGKASLFGSLSDFVLTCSRRTFNYKFYYKPVTLCVT